MSTDILIQTSGWDPELKCDCPEDGVTIGMMLPISATEGRWFFHTCYSPQQLWEVLRDIDIHPEETLKNLWGYSGPPKPPPPKSADDLLTELESL